jgi:RHS repeat-associated protein
MAEYTYGTYVDEALTMDRKVGGTGPFQRFYFHTNRMFSTYALSDSVANVAERYSYTAYGLPTTFDAGYNAPMSSSRVGNPFTFTGRELDAETGLMHYRARTYDPAEGRFKQRDFIGRPHMYAYVGGMVTIAVDPTGAESYDIEIVARTQGGRTPRVPLKADLNVVTESLGSKQARFGVSITVTRTPASKVGWNSFVDNEPRHANPSGHEADGWKFANFYQVLQYQQIYAEKLRSDDHGVFVGIDHRAGGVVQYQYTPTGTAAKYSVGFNATRTFRPPDVPGGKATEPTRVIHSVTSETLYFNLPNCPDEGRVEFYLFYADLKFTAGRPWGVFLMEWNYDASGFHYAIGPVLYDGVVPPEIAAKFIAARREAEAIPEYTKFFRDEGWYRKYGW